MDKRMVKANLLYHKFIVVFLILLLGLMILGASVTIQPGQELFGWVLLGCFFFFYILGKPSYLFIRIIVFSFGSFITLRYILFRAFYTLSPIGNLSFIFSLILFVAECYAIHIHFSGLFVSLYPRDRAIPPLPKRLPTIDVFIPTFSEDISVAVTTAIACGNFDYPRELVNIYILDDGSRLPRMNTPALQKELLIRHKELSKQAKEVGAIYLTRADGAMAKAGMLNAAFNGKAFATFTKDESGVYGAGEPVATSGELVLILDCDHIPSRDMPKKVVGHFADQEVFLVQTPHFMLNPDPLRKNFGDEQALPCESWLFYRNVQRGLDRWNAAFFCGSAAFLRRSILEKTHGLSGETITEDCETALALHSMGYRSVYVGTPFIAGLAPESFIEMIKQRQRWCQGMIQILLLKTPLLQRGLTFAQRLSYMNSCMFWLFPLVRVTFMLAPLMFLLFNLNVYNVSIPQVVAYAMPHMISSSLLAAAIQGKLRPFLHSEVLETLQSFFLFPAIFSVLISPRKPEFRTTRKGLKLDKDDLSPLAFPFIILFFLLFAGFVMGVYTWISNPLLRNTIYIAFFWNAYNMSIIICCLGAVWERKQLRSAPRIKLTEPVSLDGFPATLVNLSLTGFRLIMPPAHFTAGKKYTFSSRSLTVPVKVVNVGQNQIAGTFSPDIDKRLLIDYVYGDSGRWQRIIDSVLAGKTSYIRLSGHLFWAGVRACGSMVMGVARKMLPPALGGLMLCAVCSVDAQAESFSCPLSSLVSEKKYTVASSRGEMRVPLYLSPRWKVDNITLTILYKRSSLFPAQERPISLLVDNQRVNGMTVVSLDIDKNDEISTIIFTLPKESMIPGDRTFSLSVQQELPPLPDEKDKSYQHAVKERQRRIAAKAFWTSVDLESSTLSLEYSWRELTPEQRVTPRVLFDDRLATPKDVHLVLPQRDFVTIGRALKAVHQISLALGERPLRITASDQFVPDKDCLIIADDADILRNSAPENLSYVYLTEKDLPQFKVLGRPILTPGQTKTLRDMGIGNVTFYPWSSKQSKKFIVPFPMTPSPNHYMTLRLNITYGAGLSEKAHLDIGVNKEILTRARLDSPTGGTLQDYSMQVPTSLLERGTNTLTITPSDFTDATQSWEAETSKQFATIFGSSSLLLPETKTFLRLPELAALFVDGYPFQGNTVLVLPEQDYASIAAALNLSALLTQYAINENPPFELLPFDAPWPKNKNILFISADAQVPGHTLVMEETILSQQESASFNIKDHTGLRLTLMARTPEEMLQGVLKLWEPEIQEHITGQKVQIDLMTGKVILIKGESFLFSDLKPLAVVSYYANNFSFFAWGIILVFILLFAFLGYMLVKKDGIEEYQK